MTRSAALAAVLAIASLAVAPVALARADLAPPSAEGRIVLPADVAPVRYQLTFTPDLKALTFTGSLDVQLDALRPTRTVTLNAADLTFRKAVLVTADNRMVPASDIRLDATQETATFTFPEPLAVGRQRLLIDYAGRINGHAAGLFNLDYDLDGKHERGLFTQFENSDARRFLPSWDEPNRKAVFSLTAVVPADLMAVSNMPITGERAIGDGLKQVKFDDSPKMSSYLLFFSLGDFERAARPVDGVDVGVIAKRGDRGRSLYAIDAEDKVLRYYNDYFGVNYPLPKLDLIAGPGSSQFFGAMENWGAIFYFERDVLVDPKISTPGDRQNVFSVVAHETAHQWFGDLVTMDWWDDLWLNEGFASWMATRSTNNFHPEWNPWLHELDTKDGAMDEDSRKGAHPIIQPIKDVLQANNAFDDITYEKGEAVIRMIEAYVGPDVFRDGVRGYIKKHAYGNTVTDDLWRELDAVSGKPVSRIAHAFTLQAGVPLVKVDAICTGADAGKVRLERSIYSVDGTGAGGVWPIPVTWRELGSSRAAESQTLVLDQDRTDITAPSHAACVTPLVNAGQTAYFRTLYAPDVFTRIVKAYPGLDAMDQLGLLNDTSALALNGQQPMGDLLALLQAVPADADPVVLADAVEELGGIGALERGLPGEAAFKAYGRKALHPWLDRWGWNADLGYDANALDVRSELLTNLADFGDEQVLTEARRRFAAYRADPSSLDAAMRRVVLNIIAVHADTGLWDQLHELARNARTPLEKQELYRLLGRARDPELAKRALDLAFAFETSATDGPEVIRAVAEEHPDMAFDFVVSHLDALNRRLEPDSRNRFLPDIASSPRSTLAMIGRLDAYARAHIPESARGEVDKADAAIRTRADRRAKRTPEVDAWIAKQPH
jgi:aminopeptidase N